MSADKNWIEAAAEGAEALVDLWMQNPAIEAVPVVGSAVKVLKGLDDFRYRAEVKKLTNFFSNPALLSRLEREEIRRRLSGPDAEQVGEMLFLVLGKVTDMTKPRLLSNVFCWFLDGAISESMFRQLAHAIDVAFLDDLVAFIEPGAYVRERDNEWEQRLVSCGLVNPVNKITNSRGHHFDKTELGAFFVLCARGAQDQAATAGAT